MKVALIVVKTLFADGHPHAVFQRFLMPDNRNKQHRADKTVGLVGIADDAEIAAAFSLVSNAFFFTELIIGIGAVKPIAGISSCFSPQEVQVYIRFQTFKTSLR